MGVIGKNDEKRLLKKQTISDQNSQNSKKAYFENWNSLFGPCTESTIVFDNQQIISLSILGIPANDHKNSDHPLYKKNAIEELRPKKVERCLCPQN